MIAVIRKRKRHLLLCPRINVSIQHNYNMVRTKYTLMNSVMTAALQPNGRCARVTFVYMVEWCVV